MNDRTLDPNDHAWKDRRIAELEAKVERLNKRVIGLLHAVDGAILSLQDSGGDWRWLEKEANRVRKEMDRQALAATEGEKILNESNSTGELAGLQAACDILRLKRDDQKMSGTERQLWNLYQKKLAALAATEGSDGDEKADSEWLDIIEGECWDLRCLDVATFGGDYEVEWIVIEHHQAAPRQRQIGRGDSPVMALQDAVARTTPAPPTTDAEEE
jgi:hypothetical protein